MYQQIVAALPADTATRLAAVTGETPARAAALLDGATPLLAAALTSAAGDGLDALLGGDMDDLLRRLFGSDVDAMARSLAGSTRSRRAAGLAALESLVPVLVGVAAAAMVGQPADRAALLTLASSGRGAALAALPPQLMVVVSNFPGLARRLATPRPVLTKKNRANGNWMLALVRRMRPK